MVEFILFMIIFLSAAVLGIEVSRRSTLALHIKNFFRLTQPYPRSLNVFCRFKTWHRLIGSAFFLLVPLIFICIIILRCHRFIAELLDCEYCSAYHISWLLFYFLYGIPLIWALCIAPVSLFFVSLINRIER